MIPDTEQADKRDTLLRMLDVGLVSIHVDARHPDVSVPGKFIDNPDVVFMLSRHFKSPLAHSDDGIEARLEFTAGPFTCRFPWASITAAFCEQAQEIAIWTPPPRQRFTLLQGGVTGANPV